MIKLLYTAVKCLRDGGDGGDGGDVGTSGLPSQLRATRCVEMGERGGR